METNSQAGKINVSENTYQLVKDTFHCEYRGEIDVKNKGMMKMFFVNGLKNKVSSKFPQDFIRVNNKFQIHFISFWAIFFGIPCGNLANLDISYQVILSGYFTL